MFCDFGFQSVIGQVELQAKANSADKVAAGRVELI